MSQGGNNGAAELDLSREQRGRNINPHEGCEVLGNKIDELGALIKSQREYHECRAMCFRKTWLKSHFPDHSMALLGFKTF